MSDVVFNIVFRLLLSVVFWLFMAMKFGMELFVYVLCWSLINVVLTRFFPMESEQ